MSYDRSGLPGIWTAVRHLVSVLVGAPGPVQAAYAVPAPTSAGAASIAAIELRKVNLADMCCLLLWVDTTTLFRKCARQPSIGLTRLALLSCCLPGRLLDRPCAVGARKNRAPGKDSPLDMTSVFSTAVSWVRHAHL